MSTNTVASEIAAMPPAEALQIVAIVGRPNVGKSTLFNRFAGRRQALVEDVPGVTRDRIAAEVEVAGRTALVVDTAGLDPEAERGLPAAIQAQAQAAIDGADAILFVVDGQGGLLPEDADLARALRRTAKPLLLVVNKIDHPRHEVRMAEFYALGIERTRAVSAEHGSGAWDALEELVAELPEVASVAPEETGLRVAIVGRPNVGKSSLLNRLAGSERAVVSEVPGTTRDAVDVRLETEGGALVLVDTAGLRRPGHRTRTAERGSAMMAVRSLERAQVALLVIDAGQGFTDQDARVARLSLDRGCATALLANKWDLVAGDDAGRADEVERGISHGLRFMPETPLLRVSAKTGAGIRRIIPAAHALAAAGERRISTAELNRWLQDAVRRHEPAMAQRGQRRRPVKFFYATQTGVHPPTFVLFCTDPDAVQTSYRRFLENRLRASFDLAGTPVRLRLRARSDSGRGPRR
jgi:GTP-binding protein